MIGVTAFVFLALLAKWSLLGSSSYESQAVVQPAGGQQASDARAVAQPFVALTKAHASKLARAGKGDAHLSALALPSKDVALVCRAPDRHLAYQFCSELVGLSLTQGIAKAVLRPASLPAGALPLAGLFTLLVGAALSGLLAGLLWWLVVFRTLSAARSPGAAPGSARPSRLSVFSSAPPPRVYTVSPLAASADSVQGSEGDSALSAAQQEAEGDAIGEELRALRAQIFLLASSHGCVVVGVSSEAPDRAGKSQLAAQLASSLAASQQAKVLLLEADFEQPNVGRVMDVQMPSLSGFSQQMHRRVLTGSDTAWSVLSAGPSLSILAEGLLRTPGMLYSVQFSAAVNDLRSQYDIIIADGPVLGPGVDLRAFDDVTDAVVFVTAPGSDRPKAQRDATTWFREKQLLCVVPFAP